MTLSLTVAHEGDCQFVRLMHPVHQLSAVWTELARDIKALKANSIANVASAGVQGSTVALLASVLQAHRHCNTSILS